MGSRSWEDFTERYFNNETIVMMSLIFIILLASIMQVFYNLFGFILAFGITLFLYPIVVYAENIASSEFDAVYYQKDLEQMQEEHDEYMRIERMKMQDGRCTNCNGYLDPNLPYCPNCNFKIEDYV